MNVIPERVPAVMTLLIPRFPDATFNDLSIFPVANFAAVIVPSPNLVPLIPLATLALVTAELAMAPLSTALSANSEAPTALAAIFALVTESSAIEPESIVPSSFAAFIAPSAILSLVIAPVSYTHLTLPTKA